MHRYLLQQKFWSLTDQFAITDTNNRACCYVSGKFWTIGKKLWMKTPDGRDVFFIKQRLMRIFPRYDLYQGDTYFGKAKAKFAFFVKKVKITTADGTVYRVKGSPFAWSFKITKDGDVVGEISKSILKIADKYTVDAYSDDYLVLAISLIMDAMFHNGR